MIYKKRSCKWKIKSINMKPKKIISKKSLRFK